MLWHEKAWPEIQALDKRLPVVIPLGSVEQHGHHLPLLVDTIQVTAIAEEAERRLADKVLLLPTLWLGSSDHHRDFPGTISVAPSLYTAMIKAVVRSVFSAGFSRIFLLNGHGGNAVPGSQALSELVAECNQADSAYLVFASWWDLAKDALDPQRHGMQSPMLTHACEYETSLVMTLRGDLVHLDRAKEAQAVLDNRWTHSERGGKVRVFNRFSRFTAAGNMGQPSAATAEKGKSIFGAVVADVCAMLEDFATWPDLPAIGPR
jgi:creatinine amidohydrolase